CACFMNNQLRLEFALYTRNHDKKSSYLSNFDLFQAPITNWRDTYYCRMAPVPPKPEEIPIFM
ncbi:hypothetical protein MKW92_008096, partial [Papaver armeniacum]